MSSICASQLASRARLESTFRPCWYALIRNGLRVTKLLLQTRIERATPADASYVAARVKHGQRFLGRYGEWEHDKYWEHANLRLELTFRRGAECWVALSPNEQERFIYGFVVFEPHRLHYLFTRGSFRRHGVGSALLGRYDGPKVYTCETKMGRLARRYGWEKVDAPDLD